MAFDDLQLSLMAFPQRWYPPGKLYLNVLLLPVGDPTAALGGGPQFAGTTAHLLANLTSGVALPERATVPAQTFPLIARPPAVAPALFTALHDELAAQGINVTSAKLTSTSAAAVIHKSLPQSYTSAFAFEGPRDDRYFDLGDGYCCQLREQAPGLNPTPPNPESSIAWGQIISYALRQPKLARALGLIHHFVLDVQAGTLALGGFVYLTLDARVAGNPWVADWQANPDTVKSYAARLPKLDGAKRPLFAATLLPIIDNPGSELTDAQLEAAEYDDGFAQIVHSNQPTTIDAATLTQDQIAPGTEAGLQLGWDDEQVTIAFNKQLDLLKARANQTAPPPEAPLGLQGYRVDVRQQGTTDWHSLCVVSGHLPFNDTKVGPPASTSVTGAELWLAPAPIRPTAVDVNNDPANSSNDAPAWLPLYFAQWTGSSLVLPDPAVALLAEAVKVAGTPNPTPPPVPTLPDVFPDLTGVPVLRYGTDYEFRVRLVDLTGGGPRTADEIVHPGPAPASLARFRRLVPPKSLEVVALPPIPAPPAKPPATRTIDTLAIRRPRIGYPEAVFAGIDPATFAATNLRALISDALANHGTISVPDPDVDSFDVVVEARIPAHDTGLAGSDPGQLDDNFRVIYSVNVPFPTGEDDPTVSLALRYEDVADIATVPAPPPGTTTIPIPTGRDVRVRLYPRCAPRANYYGPNEPLVGLSSDYRVRSTATKESAPFSGTAASQLRAFYFQPGSNLPQLLAQQLGLNQDGLTLAGATGVRTVFGASGALRHTVAADGGSLTFANQNELLGHWIVALVINLERDWTWNGFIASAGSRGGVSTPQLRMARGSDEVGVVSCPHIVAPEATGNPGQEPDRTRSHIVFLDAINPLPAAGAFPDELNATYSVLATFEGGATAQLTLDIHLPITTPPAQTPRIAATGIAESPYVRADDYSSTSPRERYLWIEFDAPMADPEDAYFGRVLAYGPDPLLAASLLPTPDPGDMLPDATEPALPIDPEPIRAIFSGQAEDFSGLDAMTPLAPAVSSSDGLAGTFFLLPLPQGVTAEDLELFGFWTYEFRVGHAHKWSTAQGRFGRPLRVTGLQHPSPHLVCALRRDDSVIEVTAPYATTVINGKRDYDLRLGDPQTRIWFMLYAQVQQADGATRRNVLIDHRLGVTLQQPETRKIKLGQHSSGREPRAGVKFEDGDIRDRLAMLGLPATTGLSVLAVEVLPGPLTVREQPRGDGPARLVIEEGAIAQEDPLGSELGRRRILRTSPLTAVPSVC